MNHSPESKPEMLKTYCRICCNEYEVTACQIFFDGENRKYITKCPICGFSKSLSIEQVEEAFGELKR